MKNPLAWAAIVISALAAGCTPAEEKLAMAARAEAARQAAAIRAANARADDDRQTQVFNQRGEFVARMHRQLAHLNQSLDDLSTEVAQAKASTQAEAKPQLAALRDIATRLRMRLGEVVNATPASWVMIKAECDKAHAALSDGVARTRASLHEKSAP